MPCLAASYDPVTGALIQLTVLPPSHNSVSGVPPPAENLQVYNALIDTGASCTCISRKVVSDLNLRPMGLVPVSGVHGTVPTNSFQFRVGFFASHSLSTGGTVSGNLIEFLVDGIVFDNRGCLFDILLGRDILCKGSFSMAFNNQFIFCF